ncbi:VanZ family protein [Clostridium sp. B9]|uniref:VanZ family protein n=1 Tax=Clostridium sp. B9 TaxID=3423224 RepID=UPI003D2E9D1B
MIVISQNQILFLGILVFIFIRACILNEDKKNAVLFGKTKKAYSFDNFIFDLFCIYLIGVASKIYFPLEFAWGNELHYNMPKIWLRPIWSLMEIYKAGGASGLIYQVVGNSIILTPMAFFLCYFNQNSLLYQRGNKIICIINKFWKNGFSINFSKKLNLKDIIKICFVIALFMETSQLVLSLVIPNTARFFEINDIILNTMSGVWGYYLFYIFTDVRRILLSNYGSYIDKRTKKNIRA